MIIFIAKESSIGILNYYGNNTYYSIVVNKRNQRQVKKIAPNSTMSYGALIK